MSVIAVPAASRAQEHFRTLAILSVGLTWAIAKNKARLRAGDPSLFLRFSLCGVNFHIIIGRAHFLLFTPSNILFFFFLKTHSSSMILRFWRQKFRSPADLDLVFYFPGGQLPWGRKAWDQLFHELWKKKKKMWLSKN